MRDDQKVAEPVANRTGGGVTLPIREPLFDGRIPGVPAPTWPRDCWYVVALSAEVDLLRGLSGTGRVLRVRARREVRHLGGTVREGSLPQGSTIETRNGRLNGSRSRPPAIPVARPAGQPA